jgi:hypothetical protein
MAMKKKQSSQVHTPTAVPTKKQPMVDRIAIHKAGNAFDPTTVSQKSRESRETPKSNLSNTAYP